MRIIINWCASRFIPHPTCMHEDDRLGAYLRHRGSLLETAAGMVGRARAEDVVQEAWLRLDRSATGVQQPSGYLFRIVRNLAVDLLRRSRWEVDGTTAADALCAAPSPMPSPEQHATASADLRSVMQALQQLPALQRQAFHLHRFEEATYAQIAQRLGVSQGTAHSLVQGALAHCVASLARDANPPRA